MFPLQLTLNRSESVTTIPVNQLPAGVWRLQAASPPLGGSIRLLFRNEESAGKLASCALNTYENN